MLIFASMPSSAMENVNIKSPWCWSCCNGDGRNIVISLVFFFVHWQHYIECHNKHKNFRKNNVIRLLVAKQLNRWPTLLKLITSHTKRTCTHIFDVTKSNSLAKLVGIQAQNIKNVKILMSTTLHFTFLQCSCNIIKNKTPKTHNENKLPKLTKK